VSKLLYPLIPLALTQAGKYTPYTPTHPSLCNVSHQLLRCTILNHPHLPRLVILIFNILVYISPGIQSLASRLPEISSEWIDLVLNKHVGRCTQPTFTLHLDHCCWTRALSLGDMELNVKEHEMVQLDRVNGHYATTPKKARPILICVLVKDAIVEIIR